MKRHTLLSLIVGNGNAQRGLMGFRADTEVVDEDDVPIPVQLDVQDPPPEQSLRSSSVQAVSAD